MPIKTSNDAFNCSCKTPPPLRKIPQSWELQNETDHSADPNTSLRASPLNKGAPDGSNLESDEMLTSQIVSVTTPLFATRTSRVPQPCFVLLSILTSHPCTTYGDLTRRVGSHHHPSSQGLAARRPPSPASRRPHFLNAGDGRRLREGGLAKRRNHC